MSKLKQCIYTLILLVTCVVASPFIYKQIWESSNIKKPKAAVKEPTAVTQSADDTTTTTQEGETTETQTTSEGEEITVTTEFEDGYFASACMTNDGSGHVGICNNGLSNAEILTFTDGENFEFNGGTNFCI